jgi:hypothetical protein
MAAVGDVSAGNLDVTGALALRPAELRLVKACATQTNSAIVKKIGRYFLT